MPWLLIFTVMTFRTTFFTEKAIILGPDGLWISYENTRSILAKMAFALEWKAAGVMVFSIGSDDSKGKCGYGKYPLLSEIAKLAKKH